VEDTVKFVSKTLLGMGALALVAAPAVLSTGSSGAQAVEPIVVHFTGVGAHDFAVPDTVRCLSYEAIGAVGGVGSSSSGSGGLGGAVEGELEVLPGQTLQVNVGGKGGDGSDAAAGAAGANGGGAGGVSNDSGGGGGGGASDIRQGGTGLADRAAVGAGGGGSGSFGDAESSTSGGEGGTVGGDGGSGSGSNGGEGATVSAGGLGGASVTDTPAADGQAGASGQGGAGGGTVSDDAGAGGGGGGYFGGGGGGGESSGVPGAGGGGSNYVANGLGDSNTGVGAGNDGDGAVTLSYTPGDTDCVQAPLTITKTVTGFALPPGSVLIDGMRFGVDIQCDAPTIDLGSVGLPGTSDHVTLEFAAGGNGLATPVGPDTISFVDPTQCTATEPFAQQSEGVDHVSFTCDGIPGTPIGAGAASAGWSRVSASTVVTPDSPVCPAPGPSDGSIVVNIVWPDQSATVGVTNTFAVEIAPKFTG
jgi:hypothetical protein